MSILKTTVPVQRKTVKMSLNAQLYQDMLAYCQWAKFDRPAELVERAVEYVFAHDKAWQQHHKDKKGAPARKSTDKTAPTKATPAATKKPSSSTKPLATAKAIVAPKPKAALLVANNK